MERSADDHPHLDPIRETLHACFSRELSPVLIIEPGDTVIFRAHAAGADRLSVYGSGRHPSILTHHPSAGYPSQHTRRSPHTFPDRAAVAVPRTDVCALRTAFWG